MELKKEAHNKILKKQCEMVGEDYKVFFKPYLEGKEMPKMWWAMRSWSTKKQDQFFKWLVLFLVKELKIKRILACKFSYYWILNNGWTNLLPEPNHKMGYTKEELNSLCKGHDINKKEFYKELGVNTVLIDVGKVITYKVDVERALYNIGYALGRPHLWD
jgi:hypothetical protein